MRRPETLRVLFVYPNMFMMNMMPPAVAIFSSLLKRKGMEVALFDTTYYPRENPGAGLDASSDKRKELTLQVRPFDMGERGVRPKTTDMVEDLLRLTDSFKPHLIAMSAVEDTFADGAGLLLKVRDRRIPTLVGGVFATFAPELVIAHEAVDMVCVGEGERALVELCERMSLGKDVSDIPGLWVKGPGGQVRRNPLAPPTDLDSLPLMDFSVFEENRIYRPMAGRVYRMIPVETHRGCPYRCTYCNSPSQVRLYRSAGGGRFLRKRSVTRIREELSAQIRRWKAEYVYFWADTFLAWTDEEFRAFADMYREFRLPFWMQTRPETLTEERVAVLKDIGCHRVSIGIEHGNEEFRRRAIRRDISNAELIRRTNILGRAIPVSVNNITGFPDETRELAFDTIRLNRELEIDTMNCYSYTPYHGTPLRETAIAKGYLDPERATCSLTAGSVLNMPRYPKEEIRRIVKTFSLYARLPESEWPRIRRAEEDTPEGDAIFAELREQYIARYFNDGKATFG